MPHWNGDVPTAATPELLKPCRGDPVCVRQAIIRALPNGVSLRGISWVSGEDLAIVTLEGDERAVEEFFASKLDVDHPAGPFVTAAERKSQKGGGSA